MTTQNIQPTWQQISERFSLVGPTRDVISFCSKRNFNPSLFINNLFFVTGEKVFDTQDINEPTPSLRELLREYIPPAYSAAFSSAFPDVVLWVMNQDVTKMIDNKWYTEFFQNASKYVNDQNMLNYSGMILAIKAFTQSPEFTGFECES